jgi:hypothetical protein
LAKYIEAASFEPMAPVRWVVFVERLASENLCAGLALLFGIVDKKDVKDEEHDRTEKKPANQE